MLALLLMLVPMTRARPYDRDAALDAALDLFWRKGFHATSLKDLEVALSMKPGSIYAAFTSKEVLFRETLHRYFEAEQRRVRALAKQASSPLEGLVAHVRHAGRCSGTGRACMLVKTVLELSAEESTAGADARHYLDALWEEFRDLFAAAVTAEEVVGRDPNRLARLYQTKLIALKIEVQRGLGEAELQVLADDMAEEIAGLRATAASTSRDAISALTPR
ncbi:TetR/AcrR family transcriptional regulator [Roseivivax marinus]|uniref:TetR/AcrR family transcriptional regulator n=1 Tax=Roseivivax marinus TaxID=1379903 RepID=UPI00273D8705|nr:TetR/AcrR family transcriptional regulator [Roseivivax marinus]